MRKTRFAIIGGGWRADFFHLAARVLPEQFEVTGVLVRDAGKAKAIEQKHGVPSPRTLDALLAAAPDFVVLSVKALAAAELIESLVVGHNVPVLSETPPAPDEAACLKLWSGVGAAIERGAKVQVAEQYPFQPLHAARIALARGGRLGPINQAQVSFSQSYHGFALMRRLLGVGRQTATILARKFVTKIAAGPNRAGPPTEDKLVDASQLVATLQFAGGAVGVFDFASDQHRSWARFNRIVVRGERGEVHNNAVRYLADYRTPIEGELRRLDTGHAGNLEGYSHRGVLLDGEWLYRNPFDGARSSDEEIAVTTCLAKMADHVVGGDGFYSLADGLHDQCLGFAMNRSAESETTVTLPAYPWAEA